VNANLAVEREKGRGEDEDVRQQNANHRNNDDNPIRGDVASPPGLTTHSAYRVFAGSGQVSASSHHQAEGASAQAASLDETSAAAEEIHATAAMNTEKSRDVAELMRRAQTAFDEANRAVDQAIGAIGEINSATQRVAKINRVIDEIAFQTNILALNAAVEAARAGEAGAGFSGVADEVRKLAQRCAEAAQETAGLIDQSIAKSGDGTAKVRQLADVVRTITTDTSKAAVLAEEVNIRNTEQARGIEQIAKAVSHIESIVQGGAAAAEQNAAAGVELTHSAKRLNTVVCGLTELVRGA
jgi:methyl-accepting chemotaxis protein/methyl-accepting chemotaxis protein-1 (serine sensor receptor)